MLFFVYFFGSIQIFTINLFFPYLLCFRVFNFNFHFLGFFFGMSKKMMLTCFLNIYFQRMYVCVYAFLFMYRTNLNAADFVCVLLIYFLLQKFKFFYLLFAHISFAFVFAVIFVFRNTYHDTFFAFIVKAGT